MREEEATGLLCIRVRMRTGERAAIVVDCQVGKQVGRFRDRVRIGGTDKN